ncbi:unnamed protein product [Adineta ricciae]|uniref:Uncharacterized protein n=1 Tax=Adineta ricciae TaxID=249248 RepID=A0A813W286_ADIRI|nr:unnamed protein product [Adineta ricciae]
MQSTSLMTSDNLNYSQNTSQLWPNGNTRKRKVDASYLDDNQRKIFVTEEKLIENMRTLSLQISVNNQPIDEDQKDEFDQNETDHVLDVDTKYELHTFVKDTLRKDEFQDEFIHKMYDLERKRFSMQIVPYMPIHPAQLSTTDETVKKEEKKKEPEISKMIPPKASDDHVFKKPLLPLPYTVEEPFENTSKRTLRMKRSYSQAVRYNNNLTVVELKNDCNDSPIRTSQSDYFILEPSTPVVNESSANHSQVSLSTIRPAVYITEYFDFSPSNGSNDDGTVDMQSSLIFHACDQMDDDL